MRYYVTAGAFVDRYGPGEDYNVLRLIERVSVPVWFSYGSREVQADIAFRGMPEALAELPPGAAPRQVAVLAGGDHSYATVEMALADRIEILVDQSQRGIIGGSTPRTVRAGWRVA